MKSEQTIECKIYVSKAEDLEVIEQFLMANTYTQIAVFDENETLGVSVFGLSYGEAKALASRVHESFSVRTEILSYSDQVWRLPWSGDLPDEKDAIAVSTSHSFGSLHHSATRSLAELMDTMFSETLELGSFIDIGCGSGILCIKAFKMGFVDVWGTEIDEPAFREACRNAEDNKAKVKILNQGNMPARAFDVVLCNIQPPGLNKLLPIIAPIVGKKLLLSGFNEANFHTVLEDAEALGFQKVAEHSVRGWYAMGFQPKHCKQP